MEKSKDYKAGKGPHRKQLATTQRLLPVSPVLACLLLDNGVRVRACFHLAYHCVQVSHKHILRALTFPPQVSWCRVHTTYTRMQHVHNGQ